MIPTIGIMVALYIITRMSALFEKPKETGTITMVFAVVTTLVSLYAIYSLLKSGSEVAQALLR